MPRPGWIVCIPMSPSRAAPAPMIAGERSLARKRLERRVLAALLGALAIWAIVLVGLSISDSTQQAEARVSIDQSFARVHQKQREYRSLTGRFASWPELEKRGERLPRAQSAIKWNADRSHWYLSIRDSDSGLICDRTGEIFDEEWSERVSVCLAPK